MSAALKILFITSSLLFSSLSAYANDSQQILNYVEGVILGTEYGGEGAVCSRWTKSPKLSVFSENLKDHLEVKALIDEINSLLKGSKISVKMVDDFDPEADIKVYFSPVRKFSAIAEANGFEYISGNDGFFNIWWNHHHEITKAVVLISSKLKGKSKNHFMREEITQSLGLTNDITMYPDSIFYGRGRRGGKAREYHPMDKELIQFFYQHVKPGYRKVQVQEAFHKFWGK